MTFEHRNTVYWEATAVEKAYMDFRENVPFDSPPAILTKAGLENWQRQYKYLQDIAAMGNSKPDAVSIGEAVAPIVYKLTGGNVSYYLIPVPHPKRGGPAYVAEVEDLIEFAEMTFDEACELKAIVRTAMARKGLKKPGQDAVYDAEKRVHYATRSLATERRKANLPTT